MNPSGGNSDKNEDQKAFGLGSFYSPFPGLPGNDDVNRMNSSIHSNNRGSIHNMFWRSPLGGNIGFPLDSPLAMLIRPRNRDTPLNLGINSPVFANNPGSYHRLEYNAPLFDYNNRSQEVSQVMSSLDEDSIDSNRGTKLPKNDPKKVVILNKDLKVESIKDMTIEHVAPFRPENMFDDLKHSVHNSESRAPIIGKPQIVDAQQQNYAEEVKKSEAPPSDMPLPRKKKTKLSKKKRSKSWDEEAAKQEQLRRKMQEKRRGSLAVRKDVVNKTLLRSMKRL